jgi:hypothetical protein
MQFFGTCPGKTSRESHKILFRDFETQEGHNLMKIRFIHCGHSPVHDVFSLPFAAYAELHLFTRDYFKTETKK